MRNQKNSPLTKGHAQCHVVSSQQETGIIITATDVRNTKPHIDWQATATVVVLGGSLSHGVTPKPMWGPTDGHEIATSWGELITPISLWFMVLITRVIIHGIYKPTFTSQRGARIVGWVMGIFQCFP